MARDKNLVYAIFLGMFIVFLPKGILGTLPEWHWREGLAGGAGRDAAEAEGRLGMGHLTASIILVSFLVLGLSSREVAAQGQPGSQLTIAFDASIAPTFLDPAETPGIGTPFVFLYALHDALHDALIKPLPGNNMAPCLAESWKERADGLAYEFKLREGLKFQNGDPFTAEDVKFSFQRYRGVSARVLHERVKAVEVIDPYRVRFVLHSPWPTSWPSMRLRPPARHGSCRGSTSRRSARTASGASRWGSGPIASRA
jgi:hypothetical protein